MSFIGWITDAYEIIVMGYPEEDRIEAIESDTQEVRDGK
jgi:hypothetical protein